MSRSAKQQFRIVNTLPCLELVNTEPIENGKRVDLLRQFPHLVAWLNAIGLVSDHQARKIETRWAATAEGKVALTAAIELRAALRTMVERSVGGRPVGDTTVDAINRVLASQLSHPRLVREGSAFTTSVVPQSAKPIHLLVPVAESAADLLAHGNAKLIKQCTNPACAIYFYDTSKNQSRRWCSMNVCGSRMKAAAYYRRTRARRLARNISTGSARASA